MYDLIIRDATIIRASGRLVADIAVEDGHIAYVGSNAAGGAREVVQGIGRFVIPGVIDTQVAFRTPGACDGQDWASGSRAAASAGVTTVLDLPGPGDTTVERLRARLDSAAATCVVNHGVWMAATADNLGQIRDAWGVGLACAPLARLDHAEGDLALGSDGLVGLFEGAPGIVGVHAEDRSVIDKQVRKWQVVDDPVHNDVRPPRAAAEAVRQVLDLVKRTGRAVHICSLSTAGELNILDPFRGDLPITCSVAPYHLFMSVETAGKVGDLIKVDPPVRTELDRRALWASVKRGRIDTFASVHVPLSQAAKSAPYWQAPAGIPGVDTMFPLLMSAVKHGRFGLERLVEMCCEAPARLFGLAGKGRVEVGADADLILFSEGATHRLRKAPPYSGAGWTPYLGREVGATPGLVLVGGRVVARDGELAPDLGPARPVRYAR